MRITIFWILLLLTVGVIIYHIHQHHHSNIDPNIIVFIDPPIAKEKPCIMTRTDPNASDYMALRNVYGPVLIPNKCGKLLAANDREDWRFHDTGIDHMFYTKAPPCFYPASDPNVANDFSGRSMVL